MAKKKRREKAKWGSGEGGTALQQRCAWRHSA